MWTAACCLAASIPCLHPDVELLGSDGINDCSTPGAGENLIRRIGSWATGRAPEVAGSVDHPPRRVLQTIARVTEDVVLLDNTAKQIIDSDPNLLIAKDIIVAYLKLSRV